MEINKLVVSKVEKFGIEWVYMLLYYSLKNGIWIRYSESLMYPYET